MEWDKWRQGLGALSSLEISRCYKPHDFGESTDISMYCFSDAATQGYGVAVYLRQVNKLGKIHVSLVLGKSRVCPLKPVTIPRLELTAAAHGQRSLQCLTAATMSLQPKYKTKTSNNGELCTFTAHRGTPPFQIAQATCMFQLHQCMLQLHHCMFKLHHCMSKLHHCMFNCITGYEQPTTTCFCKAGAAFQPTASASNY